MDSRLFWATYSALTAKLKKRFLHRPNHAEGARDYEELKRLVRREGLPHYAAFCCLAAARCHQALGDAQAEAAQLAEAASLYAAAERELQQHVFSVDGSTVGFEENYVEALECYQLAVQHYLKLNNAVMAIALCTELAGLVKLLGKHDEAIAFYQTAIALQCHYGLGLLHRLHCYDAVLDCLYRQRSWGRAVQTLEELINVLAAERARLLPAATAHGSDVLACRLLECETDRLLLMLIENCTRDELLRELARLTGDTALDPTFAVTVEGPGDSTGRLPLAGGTRTYSSASGTSTSALRPPLLNTSLLLSEHLGDALEALIDVSLACDIEAMVALEATLAPDLTATQCTLMGVLVETRQKLL